MKKPWQVESNKSDLDLSENIEERLKVVKCNYIGGCNTWFYNKETICDKCPFNDSVKEGPHGEVKSNNNSTRRSGRSARKAR